MTSQCQLNGQTLSETKYFVTQKNIVIIGAGLTGLCLASSLIHFGHKITLIDKNSISKKPTDSRTTFITPSNIEFLNSLIDISDDSTPLDKLVICDDQGTFRKSPHNVTFDSTELNQKSMGSIVSNTAMTKAFISKMEPHVDFVENATVRNITKHSVITDTNEYPADIIFACDGCHGICANIHGIDYHEHNDNKIAYIADLSHDRPHNNSCIEYQKAGGTLTIVPTPNPLKSSMIWMKHINTTLPTDLGLFLTQETHQHFGTISIDSDVKKYPLTYKIAKKLYHEATVLVGESAHTMPPIGAQGFNLCVKDCQIITNLMKNHDLLALPKLYHDKCYFRNLSMALSVYSFDTISSTSNPLLSGIRHFSNAVLSNSKTLRTNLAKRFS